MFRSMSWLQTVEAVCQLQHDACLMTSSLNVLDQYALCLQGAETKLLELVVGRHDIPSTDMDSATPVPCVSLPSFLRFVGFIPCKYVVTCVYTGGCDIRTY